MGQGPLGQEEHGQGREGLLNRYCMRLARPAITVGTLGAPHVQTVLQPMHLRPHDWDAMQEMAAEDFNASECSHARLKVAVIGAV